MKTASELTGTLTSLVAELTSELSAAATSADVQQIKGRYVGGKGLLPGIMRNFKDLSVEDRKPLGMLANQVRGELEQLIAEKLKNSSGAPRSKEKWLDFSLRESNQELGLRASGLHPLTIVQREVEDVFSGMGFEILDGPHVETDYYNFEALNIPSDHPAREMQDTFWFPDLKHLLRTHTSAVQVRGIENHRPPFKFIAPGKCFRCERTDASHEMVFHQLEGMLVGKDVSVAHLIYFMNVILTRIFRREVKIRLRPGFFPFVEPGFELDIGCLICSGTGCSVCKHSGWVELLPCGMVHPAVLEMGKIDPNEYTGFAFGLGLDRLLMMRYGINDIRLIHSGDLRFISQFKMF